MRILRSIECSVDLQNVIFNTTISVYLLIFEQMCKIYKGLELKTTAIRDKIADTVHQNY